MRSPNKIFKTIVGILTIFSDYLWKKGTDDRLNALESRVSALELRSNAAIRQEKIVRYGSPN